MKLARCARALSSIALTLSVLVTGMPHAAAEPIDKDHRGGVVSSEHYFVVPADGATGRVQSHWAGHEVADPRGWDRGSAAPAGATFIRAPLKSPITASSARDASNTGTQPNSTPPHLISTYEDATRVVGVAPLRCAVRTVRAPAQRPPRTPTGRQDIPVLPCHDVQSAGADHEPARSVPETLATVAIGCGVLALASLAFFVIEGRGPGNDDD